ncbi:hypothetical protein IST4116A_05077 [Burkholderia cenocepacia]|nr:hypothetical protein IST439_05095 [Burkholderia cenocepacia]CAB5156853.1 hypothetical protein IST4129_05109 [Burkholderia cenocepacia]CAB5165048.1 hypothetical protein IST4116A_05077 [Burkholderia cenocepacia]CAB5165411.1 hypothetical protein IST4113_05108 [Burkholderia cenocepacia]CAB5165704.1 hypothetical protein IST4112_05102 [Burkholderia cenocepacia]
MPSPPTWLIVVFDQSIRFATRRFFFNVDFRLRPSLSDVIDELPSVLRCDAAALVTRTCTTDFRH